MKQSNADRKSATSFNDDQVLKKGWLSKEGVPPPSLHSLHLHRPPFAPRSLRFLLHLLCGSILYQVFENSARKAIVLDSFTCAVRYHTQGTGDDTYAHTGRKTWLIASRHVHGAGHKRKTWKKRWCVVWPKRFEEYNLIAPILFYYEAPTVR